jgi:hypothetical protein
MKREDNRQRARPNEIWSAQAKFPAKKVSISKYPLVAAVGPGINPRRNWKMVFFALSRAIVPRPSSSSESKVQLGANLDLGKKKKKKKKRESGWPKQ